ncbi:unnamed protein product [Ceratitis capitata]|uniref:(Mediterranean fruit fly) hypothetical protein n=1 Tax=Ceratitis capitata TaxID=7213 RepID=A0A811U9Z0_CERCA|nr:unnamed protein product [Ceratitis capitata]
MPPHNNFCDTQLPVELNFSGVNTAVEVDVNSSTQRNQACGTKNGLQDTKVIQHDYETVLNIIGFGTTQWIMLVICGLLLMMVINETMGMSIITIASQCDFATTSVDKAIMGAASFIGIALCSYVWGYLSDTLGRRYVLLYSTLGGCICSAISMFIPNFWLYVFMRVVVGLFIAGPSSTTYAFLGEFYTTRHCAIVMNYASLFVGIAMVYVPAIAWLVLSMDWSISITESYAFRPWRLLTFFNLLPGLIAAAALFVLPESPKLLLSLHKKEEALASVNWICKRNTGKDLDQFGVKEIKVERLVESEITVSSSKSCFSTMKQIWQETRPLLQRPYVLNFSICCIIMCGLFFSSSGMGLWFTEIQNRVSLNTNENQLSICEIIDATLTLNDKGNFNSTKLCDDTISDKSYIDSISLGMCFVLGYLLIGGVIKIFGRKATIIGSMLVSTTCCVALFWLLNPIAIVVCFIIFLTMPGLCVSLLGSAVVDLVPTHLRGKAVCICFLLGRTGSIFGSNIIGVLMESYCHLTFGFFAGCVLLCMLLTLSLPI